MRRDLPLKLRQLVSKLRVQGNQLSQANEGTHDRDVDISRPPRLFFDVAECNIKPWNSSRFNWKAKSSGKRLMFRRTCWFSRVVDTPYIRAKSESSITRRPRMRNIRLPISSAGTTEVWVPIPIYTIEPPFWFPKNAPAVQRVLNHRVQWAAYALQNHQAL